MFYVIFFISAAILFIALKLLTSLPCIPPRPANDYEECYKKVSKSISSVKNEEHLSAAENVRVLFENKFRQHPMVRRDADILEIELEGKKRMLTEDFLRGYRFQSSEQI